MTEINTQPGLHYDLVPESSGTCAGESVLDAIFTRTDRRWCATI